ncbi:hypothetical protein JB92DRAFT_1747770 [Gautieria morchelliformis]|nr:hypothetical protein JB92DRAFT_1747770 [Gautieria morchelliformis]
MRRAAFTKWAISLTSSSAVNDHARYWDLESMGGRMKNHITQTILEIMALPFRIPGNFCFSATFCHAAQPLRFPASVDDDMPFSRTVILA